LSGTSVKGIMERYGDVAVLIAGELAKKNAERKMMHEMLNEAGVPANSANGEAMCLLNRVNYLADLYARIHAVGRHAVTGPTPTFQNDDVSDFSEKPLSKADCE